MIFDTSPIEQTHGFALFLRSWWMEARDIPAGLRQSLTSLVYKLYTDILFQPDERLHFENCFVQSSVFLICKLRSKTRVSSDHTSMENISAEVSIFCPWTNWIHLVTCSKIEFREPHYWIKIYRFLRYEVMWCKKVFNPAKVSWTMSDILHLDLDLKTNWLDNVSLRNNLLLVVFLQSIKCQRKIHNNYS